MDHRFERDLSNVTAEYSLKDDGGVRVLNRGFNTKKEEWKDAEGKAYLTIAIGCTGGRHRSVVLANELAQAISDLRYAISVKHRDIERS